MGAAVGEEVQAPRSYRSIVHRLSLAIVSPPACSAEQRASAHLSPSSRSAHGCGAARPSRRPPPGAQRAVTSRPRPHRTAPLASRGPSKRESPPVRPPLPHFPLRPCLRVPLPRPRLTLTRCAYPLSSTDDLHGRVLARRPRRARLGRRAGHRARDGARARRSGRARRVLPRPARRPGGGVGEGRRVREEARGEDGWGCEA